MTAAPDVIAVGETMLSLIAVGVPFAEATRLVVSEGGAESNTCVGLVRLGLRAVWVSRLGTDPSGDRVHAGLTAAGLDLAHVRRDPQRPTGVMLRETSGAPARYHRAGSAASAIGPEDLDDLPVAEARAVLVTGITAMLGEGPRLAATALLDRARGLRVVDPNLRPGLWGSDRAAELVLPLIERCDLVLGGEAELSTLVGGTGRELAERCRALGPQEIVLKRGADGASALGPGGWLDHPSRRVPDVDPVGAGDAFNAGYLAARLRGRSVAEALELGSRCGAGVAAAVGDTAGFPTRSEIEGRST
ncbi:MAG: sugar kinase [Chloroflexota bacterium]|nr:sugar kinase [Chloroflexota bacterium]